jgi:serine protease
MRRAIQRNNVSSRSNLYKNCALYIEKGAVSLKRKNINTLFMLLILTLNIFFYLTINTSPVAATTRRVPQDYTTIQKAINAANSGDTILVDVGTYPEYVLVNKSVTLKGTNRQSIITGAATPTRVMDVKASNVRISDFTIQCPTKSYHGIWVEPPLETYYTKVDIINNTILGGNTAIFYSRSSRCSIINNTLLGATASAYGIRLYDSNYNTVAQNWVNGSGVYGINFYARSHHNNMTKNTITKCKYGVLLEYANYTTMYLNSIESSVDYGLRLSYTFYSVIKGNTLKNNKYGVYIWNCTQNQFYYNNFITNTIQQQHYGVPATNASNTWDTNTPPPAHAKGNYWSDYLGVDDGSGVGRWGEPRYVSDGVGDTLIPHQGLDTYPLMYPWTPTPPGPAPVAIFTWDPLEPIHNLPATFNASKSYKINGTIISYKWNFGDGNITTRLTPIIIHTFTSPGDYNVTLTVTDSPDGLTGSTWHIVKVLLYKLLIDVYTQQPEPYSGRGPNMPSDAYAPQYIVILYGEVEYNYEPIENKEVSFTVTDPNGEEYLFRTGWTNASGIASINFMLATNATFGLYRVFGSVEVSGHVANDTLTFLVGWIIEVLKVETVDQYGAPRSSFAKGEQVYFSIVVKNIAFTSRDATFTVGLLDDANQTIGVADISLAVPPGTHDYNLVFDVNIPHWSFVGPRASAHAEAFTTWPWDGGVAYCPEKSTMFMITP